MLAKDSYPREYVDACRARVESQLATYRAAATAARQPGDRKPPADTPFGRLEPVFFDNLLLALDRYFVHRTRAVEGKNGNPLNEVRVLAASLTEHDGVMTPIGSIRLDPARSVLGYAPGDRIGLTQEEFVRLAEAFFEELEKRFVAEDR